MEKSDFLNYRALVLEVRHLRALLYELERSLYSVPGGDFSGAPRSEPSKGSPVENKVIQYLDAVALYQAKVEEKQAAIIAIEQAIDSLESSVERMVMRLRYIRGQSWTSVCMSLQTLGYSERQVYYIHGAALRKLKEVEYGKQ